MNPNQQSPENSPREDSPESRELAPIQNTNDLLGEALRRMSPRKQQEIVAKATDEALRLQVKKKEGELDHEMAADKVDGVVEAANRLRSTGAEFEVRASHRSEHGSVDITVKNKPTSLAQRAGCFVATACYGNESHPAVVVLREFRDAYLSRTEAGRRFIGWYYRHSPPVAQFLESTTVLRPTVRLLLWPIVMAAAGILYIQSACRSGD